MAKNRSATANALKRKSRLEILELLVRTMEENEALKDENTRLKQALEKEQSTFQETGTLAEACLKLSGIFEAADRAIALYQERRTEPAGHTETRKEEDDGSE